MAAFEAFLLLVGRRVVEHHVSDQAVLTRAARVATRFFNETFGIVPGRC